MILPRREVTAPGGKGAEVGSPCCQHTHSTRGAKCFFLHGCPGNTSLTIVPRARKTATKLRGKVGGGGGRERVTKTSLKHFVKCFIG